MGEARESDVRVCPARWSAQVAASIITRGKEFTGQTPYGRASHGTKNGRIRTRKSQTCMALGCMMGLVVLSTFFHFIIQIQ